MKKAFLKLIARDRAALIPMAAAGIMWFTARVSSGFGFQLSVEEQNGIGLGVGTLLGLWIQAWAMNNLVDGTERVQENLQKAQPWVEIDGIPGPQTQSAAKKTADEAADSKKP